MQNTWCLVILHDDIIKWKHFPRYWTFVRRITRSPVNSPHKGQCRGALMFSLIFARKKKRLSKESWFKTPSRSSWRHCNDLRDDRNEGYSSYFWNHVETLVEDIYKVNGICSNEHLLPNIIVRFQKYIRHMLLLTWIMLLCYFIN